MYPPVPVIKIFLFMVARTGFEPVICWLRTNRPWPLDERARVDFFNDLVYILSNLKVIWKLRGLFFYV